MVTASGIANSTMNRIIRLLGGVVGLAGATIGMLMRRRRAWELDGNRLWMLFDSDGDLFR